MGTKLNYPPITKTEKTMHSPSPNSTTESPHQVLHPEPSEKKTMATVASVAVYPHDSAEHMIRPAIHVAEKASMGNSVNPNPDPPVHPIGAGCQALTGPTTKDV